MDYEDKLKDYREKVLAKINEKAKIKAQKKIEEKEKEKERNIKQYNKEIKRLKTRYPTKTLASYFIGDKEIILPMLKETRERKMKEYENWKAKHPTKYEVLRKKRSEWYLKMKKAGIKFKKRKYYAMPKDLSVHTHDKCRVPIYPILTMKGKKDDRL